MNARVGASTETRVRRMLGAAAIAIALLMGAPAFAQGHGGGGFHGGGGGFHGGGGFSSGGFHGGGAFRGGGGFHGGSLGFHGGSAGGTHYAPHMSIGAHVGGSYGWRGGYGNGWRGGYGGWRGGYGYGYGLHAWGGGWWGGGWWPGAYYGWSYPFFLATLPALYSTYWWDGMPYYYVNNVYYTWNAGQNGYVVTDPPMVAGGDTQEATAAPDPDGAVGAAPAAAAPQSSGIIAYPRNGQSEQQLATDKYECHVWAKGQTGFDPTSQASSSASASSRSAYTRALSACLDGRGYTVR